MVEPSAGQLLCGDPASSITAASYCLNGTKDRGSSVWWVLHLGQYKRRTRSQYTAPVLSIDLRLRLSYPDIKKPQEGHSGASVLCTRCASLRGSYSRVYLSVKIIKALPFCARGLYTVLHLRWLGAQQNFTLLYHKSAILHREQNIHELLKRCKKGKIPGFNALGSRLLPQIHSYIHKKFVSACYGGGEGSRTPVRKSIHTAFYECSLSLGFPSRIPTNRWCGSVFSNTLGQPRSSVKALSTNRRPFSSRGTLERNGRYIKRRLLN